MTMLKPAHKSPQVAQQVRKVAHDAVEVAQGELKNFAAAINEREAYLMGVNASGDRVRAFWWTSQHDARVGTMDAPLSLACTSSKDGKTRTIQISASEYPFTDGVADDMLSVLKRPDMNADSSCVVYTRRVPGVWGAEIFRTVRRYGDQFVAGIQHAGIQHGCIRNLLNKEHFPELAKRAGVAEYATGYDWISLLATWIVDRQWRTDNATITAAEAEWLPPLLP